jgi:hypothetical protein
MNKINIDRTTYGLSMDNPIQTTSVSASLNYLESLVTERGYHLLFHRVKSMCNTKEVFVDHYEIMTTENLYYDLYLSIYSEKDVFVPPSGFLFDSLYISEEFDVAQEYIFKEDWSEFDTELLQKMQELPYLEKFISRSFGRNGRLDDFPLTILDIMIEEGELLLFDKKKEDFYSKVIRRENKTKYYF